MRTLATDPVTGDLAITAGRLAVVEGVAAVAQRLRGRLRLRLGEWKGDASIGVPWVQGILGLKGAERYAEATLRRAVATCPGVASVESFSRSLDRRTRSQLVAFRALTTDGEVVDERGFVAGSGP